MTDAPASPRRRVARCPGGCVHLQWDSLMLTLGPEEFDHLRTLLLGVAPLTRSVRISGTESGIAERDAQERLQQH